MPRIEISGFLSERVRTSQPDHNLLEIVVAQPVLHALAVQYQTRATGIHGNWRNEQGAPYCLHGFNAVYLPEIAWYKVDARGNREGVNAQFTPPQEQLAYRVKLPGEADVQNVFPEPLPLVIKTLQAYSTWDDLLLHPPDISTEELKEYGLIGIRQIEAR